MNTGLVENWTGNILDIGPIYPLVGTEWLWLVVGMVLWVLWHAWQGSFESRTYAEQEAKFKGEELAKAIRGD